MNEQALPGIYLYRRVLNAKLFIEDNYAHAIDLDAISEEASFSKFHFIRLFKRIYGKTPHQFLTAVRIEKAKLSLERGISVSDTCFAVGFESIGTFSSLFKSLVNETPAAYGRAQVARKQQMQLTPRQFIPVCFAEKFLSSPE